MQLYIEGLLTLILKKQERRGGYIYTCEEAELDQAGMSINHWHFNDNNQGEDTWQNKERHLKRLLE